MNYRDISRQRIATDCDMDRDALTTPQTTEGR